MTVTLLILVIIPLPVQSQTVELEDKIYGMLIGSVIGDAAGGPLEFIHPPLRGFWTTTDKKITQGGILALADSFRLRPYLKEAEPFAQWEPFAAAGTITDDTRFKLIFFNMVEHNKGQMTRTLFAREVLAFGNRLPEKYKSRFDQWMVEIGFATRWTLGIRENAYPNDRIWGGIPTMAGQMPFLPVAAFYADNAEAAYLKTWELNYLDVAFAKDITAALVAGLVGALQEGGDWRTVEAYMRNTDPYNFNNVLYVPRRMSEWLDIAHGMAARADGCPSVLFDIMEKELQAKTWWEAWVPIVVVFACAEIVHYNPLAAMQLMIEFGHDTDSYAQVMGAIMGAIHGKEIFPVNLRDEVNRRMKEQFGRNVDDWLQLIRLAQK